MTISINKIKELKANATQGEWKLLKWAKADEFKPNGTGNYFIQAQVDICYMATNKTNGKDITEPDAKLIAALPEIAQLAIDQDHSIKARAMETAEDVKIINRLQDMIVKKDAEIKRLNDIIDEMVGET